MIISYSVATMEQETFSEFINRSLNRFPTQKGMIIFSLFLVALTLFAIHGIFSPAVSDRLRPLPILSSSQILITNKDFGKLFTVHKGDTVVISLRTATISPLKVTTNPPDIMVKKAQSDEKKMWFIAIKSGKTVLMITATPACDNKKGCPQFVFVYFKAGFIVL